MAWDVCLYNNPRMAEAAMLIVEKQMLLVQFGKTKDGSFALKLGKPMELSLELNRSINAQNLSKTVSNKLFCATILYFQ